MNFMLEEGMNMNLNHLGWDDGMCILGCGKQDVNLLWIGINLGTKLQTWG